MTFSMCRNLLGFLARVLLQKSIKYAFEVDSLARIPGNLLNYI